MNTDFDTLFYLKKPKNYKTGILPIYLRITLDMQQAELSTGCSSLPSQWNKTTGRLKGKDQTCQTANQTLTALESRIRDIYRFFIEMEPDLVLSPHS